MHHLHSFCRTVVHAVAVVVAFAGRLNGADLVDLSPSEQAALRTEYSVLSTGSCPDGACPIPYAPRAPHERSIPPIHQPPSNIHHLSAAAFDSVVKLSADNGHGGSGVLVDCGGQPVILTAEHVVRGAGKATVTFRDGQRLASHEILVDRGRLDLAAVFIDWPERIKPAAIGDMPRAGDTVTACGYGPDDTLAGLPNTVRGVRYSRLGPDVTEPDSLEMLGTFRSGDSGGPVFNRCEQVVAIINASSVPGAPGQSNVAVGCRPIRAFLARLRARIESKGQRGEGKGKGNVPGEIAPGVPVPQVEFGAQGGCQCDNEAVLKKLESLESQSRTQNAEWGKIATEERQGLAARMEELKQRLHERLLNVASREDVAAVAAGAPAAGLTIGKLVAAALGLSTPVGLGIGVAGWLIGRRVRRRVSKRAGEQETDDASPSPPLSPAPLSPAPLSPAPLSPAPLSPAPLSPAPLSPAPARTVILETPPPPQVIERTQQFVPYQAHSARLDALERAIAEYVRKYPSAAGVFETINAYAEQFQSGEKKTKVS